MTVETFGNGGFVVTGNDINTYMLLSIYRSLRLEVQTGMKFSNRVNVSQQAKQVLSDNGIRPKSKKVDVLVQFAQFLNNKGIVVK
jgi:hypothetical protein